MRLIGKAEDLKDSRILEEDLDRDRRQLSRLEELSIIFFKEGMNPV